MKGLKLYLIAGAVLLIIYIIAQLNKPKVVDWSVTLSSKDKIPFGTYVLSKQLTDIFPGSHIVTYRQPIYNVIAEDSISKSSYIIICPGMEISKADYGQLVKYLKQGNDVFMAAGYYGPSFEKELKVEVKTTIKLVDKPLEVNFLSPHINHKNIKINKGAANAYFAKFDTLKAVVISENADHKANLIKYSFGKGNLYLCANPLFFSNYSLLHPQGVTYAETALSFVKNTGKIILDDYYTQGDIGEDSPMRLFLSNPALRWAYYITLFGLLAFVLFEIKRRQRIIPVIEPLNNASLDFVKVVGGVYYEKHNNADIAQKKILYFLAWLREEYQVKTNKLDEEFTEKITGKLGIERRTVDELVNYIKYIGVQNRVNDNELIELNNLIEKFYYQAK